MTRSRWVVLLGPPLILILGVGAATAAGRAPRAPAGAPPVPRPVTACSATGPVGAAAADRAPGGGFGGSKPGGAHWRSTPTFDRTGSLIGWTVIAGVPGGPEGTLDLPAASSASGPDRGRVIVAVDDGARSSIHVVDAARSCDTVLDLGDVVARRAIADPLGDGFIVHLLDRTTRADLGVWQVSPDGRRSRLLAPLDDGSRDAAGIRRVWATNLLARLDGRRLAVQACDPESCLTRIVERPSGRVTSIVGAQGELIGFSGDRLITWAACHGMPCGLVAWSPAGTATTLTDSAIGAAVAPDGTVVIAVQRGSDEAHALAIDVPTRGVREIGPLAAELLPVPATARFAGIEAGPDGVGLVGPTGQTSELEVLP